MKTAHITETFPKQHLYYNGRLAFSLHQAPTEPVILQFAAEWWARIWINGQYIGRNYVRTHEDEYRYEQWDLQPYLKQGDNVLAVQVHVWGEPEAVIPGVPPPCPARLALVGQVEDVDFADWTRWRFAPDPAYRDARRHNSLIGHEENRDLRLDPTGWRLPGFDDRDWQPPCTGESARQWNPSLLRPLKEEAVYPQRIIQQGALLPGQMWETEAPRNNMPFWRTFLELEEDAEITFLVLNYVSSQLWVDGKSIFMPNEPAFEFFAFLAPIVLKLTKGRHIISGYHCVPPAVEPVGQEYMPPPVLRIGCSHIPGQEPLHIEWSRSMHGPFEPAQVMRRDPDNGPLADTIEPRNDASLGTEGAISLHVANTHYALRLELPFNMTVLPIIEIEDATAGAQVDVIYSEFMSQRDGLDLPGTYVDRYTLREGPQTLDVSFQYKSARIITLYLHAPNGHITLKRVSAIYRHYDYEQTGALTCSDPRLEQIWQIGRNTIEMGSQDFIMDGAWREQLFYLGDSNVAAQTCYHLFRNTEILDWEFTLLKQGQMEDGLFQPIQPSRTPPELYRLLDQSILLPLMLERHLFYTGKIDFVQQMMPTIIKEMLGFQQCFGRMASEGDPRLRKLTGWNWVDHLGLEDGIPRSMRHDGIPSAINFLYLQALQATQRLLAHFDVADEQITLIRDALQQKLTTEHWNPARNMFADCVIDGKPSHECSIHINLLAILTGCAENPAELIKRTYKQSGVQQICGYSFRDNLYEAMRIAGMQADILEDIREQYGPMLDEGLTTTAENVPLNGHWWASVAHAYSTAPNIHLAKTIAGLRPLTPGWKTFAFEPCLADLNHLSVIIPTPAGDIRAEITNENGESQATLHHPDTLVPQLPSNFNGATIPYPTRQA